MRPNNPEVAANAMKVAKRIAKTIACCIPVMILFAYLTRNIITTSFLQILCFVGIMAVAVTIVEIIARKREKVKIEESVEHKDVFR